MRRRFLLLSLPILFLFIDRVACADRLDSLDSATSENEGSETSRITREPGAIRDPFQLPALLNKVIREKELVQEPANSLPVQTPPPAIQPPPLKLQGILWGASRSQAIVNRRIVSVGDTVDDVKIVEIKRDSVKVSFQGREFSLPLPQAKSTEKQQPSGEFLHHSRGPY